MFFSVDTGWLFQMNFDGKCLLYSEVTWRDSTHFKVSYSSAGPCQAPVYTAVIVGIVYAVGMGTYYVYALTRRDPSIG